MNYQKIEKKIFYKIDKNEFMMEIIVTFIYLL